MGRDRNKGGAMIIIIAVSLVTWIMSFLIIRAISRYREYSADRGAAQLTQRPKVWANALLKISGNINREPTRELRHVEGYNAFFIIPCGFKRKHF